ncbi:MAG: J domain-containing protein [Myxococcales bacterium]|nr:J domain-containing protein [Myxococcales bacterium]
MSFWNRLVRIVEAEIHDKRSAPDTEADLPGSFPHQGTHSLPIKSESHTQRRHQDPELARHYAIFELPYGSSFSAVKAQYKRLVRIYHPDRHTHNPRLHDAATRLTQQLHSSYLYLQTRLNQTPN